MSRQRTLRRSLRCASAVVVGLTFLAVAGSASAGTAKAHTSATVYSAAHAQYGQQKVLKPTVSAVAPAKVTHTKTPVASVVHTLKNTQSVGTLPFTGLSLLKIALIALGVLALGFMLRRQSSRDS